MWLHQTRLGGSGGAGVGRLAGVDRHGAGSDGVGEMVGVGGMAEEVLGGDMTNSNQSDVRRVSSERG